MRASEPELEADSLPDRVWVRKYPPGVPPEVEIPDLLLSELVAASVERWPRRIALRYYGAAWSYRAFWTLTERLAGQLARDGIGPGDRVGIYLPNGPLYPIALFAILRLGASAVQISPLYRDRDLAHLLGDAQPKAVVTLEILYPNLRALREEVPVPVVVVARLKEFYPAFPVPKRWFVDRVLRRQHLPTGMPTDPEVRPWARIARSPARVPLWKGDPATTVALLQYTGGTTGRPKGAMLSHRNLVANVIQANAWNTTRRPGEEVILAAIPFFHIYGLTIGALMGLADGATLVIQTRPEVGELLRLISRYRPTQFPGVPALYQALLDRPDLARYRLTSIRYCLSGSAPLPVAVAQRFEAVTGAHLVEGYGLSETSPATHANPVEGERRAGSIGIPLPNTDQRIVDLETASRVLPVGEVGELCVKGPQVMLGYYHEPEETRTFLRDGWFRTGDVARLDADGYAYLVDRKKDMISVGGLKVYPREVEEVLFTHPAVADVAVVGVPDAREGEVVRAVVVRRPGTTVSAEELIAFVRARLAHYKAPRRVEFRDALPRTGVQKVLRRVLRDEAIRADGGDPSPTGPGR